MSTSNTIGVIHWEAMSAGTTGDQIALVIPAFFQGNHVPFLRSILAPRLDELFDYQENLRVEITPGELAQSSSMSRYDEGTITIYGIEEPWPDPREFRDALDDAFAQAGEVEAAQMRRADALVRHLRAVDA